MAAGTAFLVNLLAAAAMAPDQRGYLALFLQIGYLLTICLLVGIERPFAARISGGFSSSLSIFLRTCSPGLLVLIPAAGLGVLWWLLQSDLSLWTLALIAVFAVSNVAVRAVRSAYIASGAIRPFAGSTITIQAVILALAAVLAMQGISSSSVWLGLYIVANTVAVVICVHALLATGGASGAADSSAPRALRIQGLKLMPASLGNSALMRSDRLLLPVLGTPAQLGYYVVVAAAVEVAAWPVQQWVDTQLKRWSDDALSLTGRRMARVFAQALVFLVVTTTALGLLALLVLRHWLPPSYGAAVVLIVPLAISTVLFGLTRVQQGVLIARAQGGQVSVVEITGLVVSLLTFVLLIPLIGAIGAAIGAGLGNFTSLLISSYLLMTAPKHRSSS